MSEVSLAWADFLMNTSELEDRVNAAESWIELRTKLQHAGPRETPEGYSIWDAAIDDTYLDEVIRGMKATVAEPSD